MSVAEEQVQNLTTKVNKLVRSNKITYHGHTGYFVSKSCLDKIEDEIDDELENNNPNVSELNALRAELSLLRDSNKVAEASLIATRKDVDQLNASVKAKAAELEKHKAAAKTEAAAYDLKHRDLQKQLEQQKHAVSQAKLAASQSSTKFDPEEAVNLKQQHQEAVRLFDEKQRELQALNTEHKAVRNVLDKQHKDIAALRKTLAEKSQALTDLQATKTSADLDAKELVPVVEVTGNSLLLNALLGEKGREWFAKAAIDNINNMRERVYSLTQALKGNKDKRLRGIFDLLQVIFEWLKNKSEKMKLRVKPWLDKVMMDISENTMKSLKFYREYLEEILQQTIQAGENQVIKAKTFYKEKRAETQESAFWQYFDSLYGWTMAIKNRITRPLKKGFGKVKGFFLSLRGLFTPKQKTTYYTVVDGEIVEKPMKNFIFG